MEPKTKAKWAQHLHRILKAVCVSNSAMIENRGSGIMFLVPNPGYPTYTSLSKLLGAKIVNYDLLPENDWQPDFEQLEKMDLSRVKLLWTNYPNMPTGARARRETYERLVDFALRHNIIVVNDNPYSLILNEGERLSILQIPRAKECCIEFNSMSKSHNMPGWRVGMLATNAQFVQWILYTLRTSLPYRDSGRT